MFVEGKNIYTVQMALVPVSVGHCDRYTCTTSSDDLYMVTFVHV